ncbi:hypothetical protein PFISCL1PPCAC_14485, partial [Pristionchus fissidentatus]
MLLTVVLVLLTTQAVNSFVFSCNEVKYNMINAGPQVSTDFVCIALEEYTFRTIILLCITAVYMSTFFSLSNLANIPGGCLENERGGGPWRIITDSEIGLNCDFEFSLIFTSTSVPAITPVTNMESGWGFTERVFTSPRGGMLMGIDGCGGDGNVTWFSGAGTGEDEKRFKLQSWSCADLPRWVVSFENVVTVVADTGITYGFTLTNDYLAYTTIDRGQRAVILTSGQSDNYQDFKPHSNIATF